jgi:hypothetical protein
MMRPSLVEGLREKPNPDDVLASVAISLNNEAV